MERLATALIIADLIWNIRLKSIRVADAAFNTETLEYTTTQLYELSVK